MDDKFFDSQAKTKEELGRALRVSTKYMDKGIIMNQKGTRMAKI